MLQKTNKNLNQNHTFIIEKSEIPFTNKDWNELETIIQQADYEIPKRGDTNEKLLVKIMRAKKPSDPYIYNKPLLKLLLKDEFYEFIKNKFNMPYYFIDRVQIHKYDVNGFIALHCDADSCKDYKYSLSLHMNDGYEGGYFKVRDNNNKIFSFKAPKYSILVTDSSLFHEVTKVTQGYRIIIVWFISEKDLNQKTF